MASELNLVHNLRRQYILWISPCIKEAKAFLENFQKTRRKAAEPKMLTILKIEERLETIIRARGEKGIHFVSDTAARDLVCRKIKLPFEQSFLANFHTVMVYRDKVNTGCKIGYIMN